MIRGFLGAVLLDDDPRIKSGDRRDHGRSQHRMIAFDLAVAALAGLAMRTGDLLAAEILGPVESDERSAAEPAEGLAHRRFKEQFLSLTMKRRDVEYVEAS